MQTLPFALPAQSAAPLQLPQVPDRQIGALDVALQSPLVRHSTQELPTQLGLADGHWLSNAHSTQVLVVRSQRVLPGVVHCASMMHSMQAWFTQLCGLEQSAFALHCTQALVFRSQRMGAHCVSLVQPTQVWVVVLHAMLGQSLLTRQLTQAPPGVAVSQCFWPAGQALTLPVVQVTQVRVAVLQAGKAGFVHAVSFTHSTQTLVPPLVSQDLRPAGQALVSVAVQAVQRWLVPSQTVPGRLAQSAVVRHCTQVPPLHSGVAPEHTAPPPHRHTPKEHRSAALVHARLQPPQWSGSLSVSMHMRPQQEGAAPAPRVHVSSV